MCLLDWKYENARTTPVKELKASVFTKIKHLIKIFTENKITVL